MQARPLHLVSPERRQRVQAALADAAAAWAGDWGVPAPMVELRPAGRPGPAAGRNEPQAGAPRRFGAVLLGAPEALPPGGLAAGLATAGWRALNEALAAVLGARPAAGADAAAAWELQLAWPAGTLAWWLDAPALAAACARFALPGAALPPLTPVRLSALGPAALALTAELGHADLSMTQLLGLRVGDVVVLDRPLNGKVGLEGRRGVVARGLLGQVQGRLALELTH